jgi:hypothetical protein
MARRALRPKPRPRHVVSYQQVAEGMDGNWNHKPGDVSPELLTSLIQQQATQDEKTAVLKYATANRRPGPPRTSRQPEHPDENLLARFSGNLVQLHLAVDIDIDAEGWARISYFRSLLNLTERPITRTTNEFWFENTQGPLVIKPGTANSRQIAIQRLYDSLNLCKFSCQISPPIRPGESAVVAYTCEGGQFLKDYFWQQAARFPTRHLVVSLRHQCQGRISSCTATEQHPDGSENSATEDLIWEHTDDGVVIRLQRSDLLPNQTVTLRWAVDNVPT